MTLIAVEGVRCIRVGSGDVIADREDDHAALRRVSAHCQLLNAGDVGHAVFQIGDAHGDDID